MRISRARRISEQQQKLATVVQIINVDLVANVPLTVEANLLDSVFSVELLIQGQNYNDNLTKIHYGTKTATAQINVSRHGVFRFTGRSA